MCHGGVAVDAHGFQSESIRFDFARRLNFLILRPASTRVNLASKKWISGFSKKTATQVLPTLPQML